MGKEAASVLARHLQNLGSLFCQSSRTILLEILEHHAIVDKLTDEEQVFGLSQCRKSTGRNGSIADKFR